MRRSGHGSTVGAVAALLAFVLVLPAWIVAPTVSVRAAAMAYVVTTTADDANDAICTARCTLRQAVTASNANDPGAGMRNAITFAPGVAGAIMLNAADGYGGFLLTRAVSITGPGAGVLAVARSTVRGTPEFRIFTFVSGGAVSISGLTITGGSVSGVGGSIFNRDALALTNVTISGNTATVGGGGINNDGVQATMTITNSTISGNAATGLGAEGGGIRNVGGLVNVTNSTISGNSAFYTERGIGPTGRGGGIIGGRMNVTNSTISGNTAGAEGGGIYTDVGTITLTRSIVAGNITIGGSAPNIAGGITDGGNNLIGGDPRLGPLQDNGGPTQTMLPAADSPAIDAGGACPTATDQRGVPRPQGRACDIGAVEVQITSAPSLRATAPPASAPPAPMPATRAAGAQGVTTPASVPPASVPPAPLPTPNPLPQRR